MPKFTKQIIILIFTFFLCAAIDDCRAQNDISFVLDKIRKNYFPLEVGKDSFAFENYVHRSLNQTVADTFEIISKIVNFFNDPHLILTSHLSSRSEDSLSVYNLFSIVKVFNNATPFQKKVVGFWVDDLDTQIVGIYHDSLSKLFKAYIYRRFDDKYLGKIAFTFSESDSSHIIYSFWEYGFKQMTKIKWLDLNLFQIGNYSRWHKINPNENLISITLNSKTNLASAKKLDTGVIYFKIPLCSESNMLVIDSLTKVYEKELRTSKKLVIDIRDNPGGDPKVFRSLLPYIYTNPIFRGLGKRFASDDLIAYEKKYLLRVLDSTINPVSYLNQKKLIQELESNRNQLYEHKGKDYIQNDINSMPEKVIVLANYACMSASEMILLDMRQSKKVTIFGENTAGATDNLNYFPIGLPSKKYVLYIPSIRINPTEFYSHYEGVGIHPDIEVPINEKDWILFALTYEKD